MFLCPDHTNSDLHLNVRRKSPLNLGQLQTRTEGHLISSTDSEEEWAHLCQSLQYGLYSPLHSPLKYSSRVMHCLIINVLIVFSLSNKCATAWAEVHWKVTNSHKPATQSTLLLGTWLCGRKGLPKSSQISRRFIFASMCPAPNTNFVCRWKFDRPRSTCMQSRKNQLNK